MAGSDDPAVAKDALRRVLLQRRRARSAPERAAAARAVAAALVQGLRGARTLAAFVPDASEPGWGRLPEAYGALGARVLLPVVPADGRVLDWAVHDGELEVGRFGLSQPSGPRLGPAALADADAVVVPALAVDGVGVRLGRGGGYYDRALLHASADAALVAVVFDDERLDELPRERHDRPVAVVVTPSGGWEPLDRPGGTAEDR